MDGAGEFRQQFTQPLPISAPCQPKPLRRKANEATEIDGQATSHNCRIDRATEYDMKLRVTRTHIARALQPHCMTGWMVRWLYALPSRWRLLLDRAG